MDKYGVRNAISIIGLVLSCGGCAVLIIFTVLDDSDPLKIVTLGIYGSSLIIYYAAAVAYYTTENKVIYMFNRFTVFYLIVGSYTPICLYSIGGAPGWTAWGLIIGVSLSGLIVGLLWKHSPIWAHSIPYLLFAVLILIPVGSLISLWHWEGIFLIHISVILLVIASIVYMTKSLETENRSMTSHEVAMILVLIANIVFYWVVYKFV